jgi:galactokinase
VRERFAHEFGRPAEVVARAPGRVNLIGEHTDYNDGFVLPIALTQATRVAVAARADSRAQVVSSGMERRASWPVEDWHASGAPRWTAYVAGVAALLRKRGARLAGFDLLVESDVPIGGGLSSSAALEVAAALALSALCGEALEATELIDLCRAAEHEFAGVPCGLMDQTVSLLGRAGHALLLDCRSRAFEHIPVATGTQQFVVVDSNVRHELAAGEYARRQAECERAVAYFQRLNPAVRALRDVPLESVRAQALQMDPLLAARALHVVSEIRRTQAAAEALRRGELAEFGRLMSESHRSLRDDYEVSCDELDELVRIALDVPGALGARMTGGGFGGCIVALIPAAALPELRARVEQRYDRPGRAARVYAVAAGPGATIESA